jgi:hypothetical protein
MANKEATPTVNKLGTTKSKRLPRGERIHVRRLKQAARKAGAAAS